MTARKRWEDYPPPIRDEATGCLRWQGPHHSRGYGRLCGKLYAHRVAWEREHGPIPDGLTIDHVYDRGCRHRDCVAVEHMELLPQPENTARSLRSREQRAKTHCPQGHEYTAENTMTRTGRSGRDCRECQRLRSAARYARESAALAAAGTPRRTYTRRTA